MERWALINKIMLRMKTAYVLLLMAVCISAEVGFETMEKTMRCSSGKLNEIVGEVAEYEIEKKRLLSYEKRGEKDYLVQVGFKQHNQHEYARITDNAVVRDEVGSVVYSIFSTSARTRSTSSTSCPTTCSCSACRTRT